MDVCVPLVEIFFSQAQKENSQQEQQEGIQGQCLSLSLCLSACLPVIGLPVCQSSVCLSVCQLLHLHVCRSFPVFAYALSPPPFFFYTIHPSLVPIHYAFLFVLFPPFCAFLSLPLPPSFSPSLLLSPPPLAPAIHSATLACSLMAMAGVLPDA